MKKENLSPKNRILNILSFFKENHTIIYVLIVLISYIYNQFYFFVFNINIIEYYSIIEIATLFLGYSIPITFILFFIIYANIKIDLDYESNIETIKTNENSNTKKLFTFNNIIISISLISLIYILYTKEYIYILLLFSFILMNISPSLISNQFKKQKSINGIELISLIHSLILFSSLILFFCIQNFVTAYQVSQNKETIKDVNFTYYNTKIKTNDTIKYIGQTNQYLFIFNRNKKETKVFEKANIKYFSIKQLNNDIKKPNINENYVRISNKKNKNEKEKEK